MAAKYDREAGADRGRNPRGHIGGCWLTVGGARERGAQAWRGIGADWGRNPQRARWLGALAGASAGASAGALAGALAGRVGRGAQARQGERAHRARRWRGAAAAARVLVAASAGGSPAGRRDPGRQRGAGVARA